MAPDGPALCGRSAQALVEKMAFMARWEISDVAKFSETLLAIKPGRLEAESVQPDALASALTGQVFSRTHQSCARTLGAHLVGNAQELNEDRKSVV